MLAKPKRNIFALIFALAVTGGDGNRVAAYDRLRKMAPQERAALRCALAWLDDVLDQVSLDLHLERGKPKPKRRRESYAHQ